jgi:class 3 adenylate cyclase/tetratricopeptide (TPR) repeat protein
MSEAAATRLDRRLAAVMFTDMAGYTALMQRDEAAALRSRERHRSALERAVPAHDGEILQYFGDGSLSVFRSSVHAVEAAIAIQRGLGGEPPLRIGLHVGEIASDEQGAYGDAINIASRLETLAVPGGVLISDKVFDDIRRHPQLAVVPSGSFRLKNVGDPVRTYAMAVEGVAVPPAVGDEDAQSGRSDDDAGSLPAAVRQRLDDRTRLPTFAKPVATIPGRVPLVGRDREIELLRSLLEQAEEGRGGTAFFRGPRGVGKSRLGQEATEYTKARGWTVLSGRAYPAERMIPFAPFSDALLPVLQNLDPKVLSELVPGGDDAIFSLFPSLGPATRRLQEADGQPGEPQARLFWHFASLVARLAEYRPLLLIIEDLDFADRSSIELFHFVARQGAGKPVYLIGQYTGTDPARKKELMAVEQSLVVANAATVFDLQPLSAAETDEFVRGALDIDGQDTRRLSGLIHQWTGGNPFFVTGTLRGLVDARVLTREGSAWRGLDQTEFGLPPSVRDQVLAWLGNLSPTAYETARLIAVVGTQIPYEVLLHLSENDGDRLSAALDELMRHQILVESEQRFTLVYDFRHPLIRETLRSELSLVDRRRLHGHVASRLEAYYGEESTQHADELAYHFGQANPGEAGAKAIRYLAAAGYRALERYANKEAVEYLQEALDRMEASPQRERADATQIESAARVIGGLARGRRRLGDLQASVALGRRVLALAKAESTVRAVAKAQREIALTYMTGGRFEEAIEEFEHALESAKAAADLPLVIRTLLGQGFCYQAAGRGEAAEAAVRSALQLAEEFEQPDLIGRAHGALMRMHIWTGRLLEARSHAERALPLARASGDPTMEFWSQWAMGAMEGLIGNTAEMGRRIEAARVLAQAIGSPLLLLETAELEVEYSYARGEWDHALTIGDPAIALARSLDARTILPRLLVWMSMVRLGRGDLQIADEHTREAWDVSGAQAAVGAEGFSDVHTVVPAHIGRAAYHLARGDWGEAARTAEAGLAIADRTGYVVWAIHHVLPIIGEAAIHARNLPRAKEVGARMRREAEAVGHPMGLAWAEACDAVLTWLEGDARQGAVALRRGAEAMEGIPLVYESSRLRRQLAGRLAEIGDRDGALTELRRVHASFTRLGARPELEKTLGQFAELGVEPPR